MDISYYKQHLTEIFNTCKSEQHINETIQMILESGEALTPEENLESMINSLVESGDSALAPPQNLNNDDEGAVGFANTNIEQSYDTLLELFPSINRNFLTQLLRDRQSVDLTTIIEDLSKSDYEENERDPVDIWDHLREMLPNADPQYLYNQARVLVSRPQEELEEFIQNVIEKDDYPTMQDYLKNKEEKDELAVYGDKFSIPLYLEKVPDPIELFSNPERKPVFIDDDKRDDIDFALNFFYNQFNLLRKPDINRVFSNCKRDLIATSNKLKSFPKAFLRPRPTIEGKECKNIPLLQQITFLRHEKQIRQAIKQKNEKYGAALEEARKYGLLETCACCFYDEIIPEECYFCDTGCIFCKECVRRGAEIRIGQLETSFPCLADCKSEFSYPTLQMVLPKKMFQRLCERKQIEEIKKANIDGLETCPFCDFSMIPAEGDKIFKCGNSECMKESCRECHHLSHIPLRCSEIEYEEDVKLRTYIENKMTEALLRECWSCRKKFYKESGCNKMTCRCGARMCYVCGQAVMNDYSHFNDRGCPLYTSDLKQYHLNKVLQGAQSAKRELGVDVDPNRLKFDPAKDLANNYV